jgi:hypothetical protein
MLLPSLALVAVLLCAGLVWLVVTEFRATNAALIDTERLCVRHEAFHAERTLFVEARTRIADAAQTGTDSVRMGATITRGGHRAIAAVPFGILGAIPATRPGSRRVRAAHDSTADVVYGTIDNLSARIGEAVRRRMVGEETEPEV